MTELITYFMQGVGVGALYAIIALPLSLVWSTTACFDIAVGAYATLGGLVAAAIGLPLGGIVGLLSGASLGAAMAGCLLALDRNGARTPVNVLIIGFGFLTVVESFALWRFGTAPATIDAFNRAWSISGVVVQPQHVLTVLAAGALVISTSLVLHRTGAGRVMRACAQNRHDLPLVGISPRAVQTVVLVLSGTLGAGAGILLSVTSGIRYDSGLHLVVSALGALILFGMRGPASAAAGGVAIGVVESMSNAYAPDAVASAVPLVLIVAVLASGRFEVRLAGART